MINNVTIQGNIVRDIDLRYTQNGKAVASFPIASQRDFKNQNNEYESDFIDIVIWGKPAETVANHFSKGSEILITGRIQSRNYENNEGKKVYVKEIVAEKFSFTRGSNKVNENQQQNNQSQTNNNFDRDSDPFGQSSQIDISDSQLPF